MLLSRKGAAATPDAPTDKLVESVKRSGTVFFVLGNALVIITIMVMLV